jgi:hypothetical protein
MIRWKNKNPYINLVRETSKVILSKDTASKKIRLIDSMINRDYSGTWLFSHPSHKHLGNGVPQEGDDISENPYFHFYSFVKNALSSENSDSMKVSIIHMELAWQNEVLTAPAAQDWVHC